MFVCRAERAANRPVVCGNVETCGPTDCTTGATSTGEFDTSVRRAQGLLDAKKKHGARGTNNNYFRRVVYFIFKKQQQTENTSERPQQANTTDAKQH